MEGEQLTSGQRKREAFWRRTNTFALMCARLADTFPRTSAGRNAADQLFRCSTSVASNYRAACRARSDLECLAKLGIVEEEADESHFWLCPSADLELCEGEKVDWLKDEANELTAIVVTSIKNMRERMNAQKKPKVVRESSAGDLFGDVIYPPTSALPPPPSGGL